MSQDEKRRPAGTGAATRTSRTDASISPGYAKALHLAWGVCYGLEITGPSGAITVLFADVADAIAAADRAADEGHTVLAAAIVVDLRRAQTFAHLLQPARDDLSVRPWGRRR